jgi:uncharacterized protein (UPF0332 family)
VKEGTGRFLEKATRSIEAAEVLLRDGYAEFAAARAYFAMLYTAQALLAERGVAFHKHGSVHTLFGRDFAKTGLLDAKFHRWLLDAYDVRVQGD